VRVEGGGAGRGAHRRRRALFMWVLEPRAFACPNLKVQHSSITQLDQWA
jgi:hypothetical protein